MSFDNPADHPKASPEGARREELEKELEQMRAKLQCAVAWDSLQKKAYTAALYHDINYLDLPEYKDRRLLQDAKGLRPDRAVAFYVQWCRQVEHGIEAAVRRKQFRKV